MIELANRLENRILDRIVIVSILTILIYVIIQAIESIIKGLPVFSIDNGVTLVILLFYLSYYPLKKTGFNALKNSIFIIFYASAIGSFFSTNGFYGPSSLDFLSLAIVGVILYPKAKQKLLVTFVLLSTTMLLLFIQFNYPIYIGNIIVISEPFTLALALITRLILGFNLAFVIVQEYGNEQKKLARTIAELHKTQEQLIQNEKMASLGILTSGVSHEINNPLNFLKGAYLGFKEYFKNKGNIDDEATELLDGLNVGVNRINKIVKGLDEFSRDDKGNQKVYDLHMILENCISMLSGKIDPGVNIVKSFSRENIEINVVKSQMNQVFINILLNSIQAVSEDGEIEVKTFKENQSAIILITDNGSGIKSEHLSRVMDPLFTTKDPGEGTGLGLSIAYSIMKEHKGKILIESELGKGTTVKLCLPLAVQTR